VDTGAEMTVIPGILIPELGTKASDEVIITDHDNRSEEYSAHAVHLQLGRKLFRNVIVVPSASGAAFLGLDILNQLKLTLDGPKNLSSFTNPELHRL
jgi:hypothetical protein